MVPDTKGIRIDLPRQMYVDLRVAAAQRDRSATSLVREMIIGFLRDQKPVAHVEAPDAGVERRPGGRQATLGSRD
jgi:hypothetical protein